MGGTLTFNADGTWNTDNQWVVDSTVDTPAGCSDAAMCAEDARLLLGTCVLDASKGCACVVESNHGATQHGTYVVNGASVTLTAIYPTTTTMGTESFCASGQTLRTQATSPYAGPTFILTKQ